MAWTKQQAKLFASQVKRQVGDSWWAFVPEIREAIIDAKVMGVVLGQDNAAIAVDDIRKLRNNIALAMAALGLRTPTSESWDAGHDPSDIAKGAR